MRARAVILVGLAACNLSFTSPNLHFAATDPTVKIEYIEIIFVSGKTYATVHYDIQPSRAYVLQGATNLINPKWETLISHRALPFQDQHYIYADELTNTARHYRLFVTP